MPRDLHALPGGKILVNGAFGFLDLVFHAADFVVEVDVVGARVLLQVGQLLLELGDGFFKIKRRGFHGESYSSVTGSPLASIASMSSRASGVSRLPPLVGFCTPSSSA